MAALGFQETINFSFVQERWEHELAGNTNPIRLLNPIASQMNVMRSSLLGSLLLGKFSSSTWIARLPRVRVFELGRVFWRDAAVEATDTSVQGIAQPHASGWLGLRLAESGLHWGEKSRDVDFFDDEGRCASPAGPPRLAVCQDGTSQPCILGAAPPSWTARRASALLGELHPRWRQAYELPMAPMLFEIDSTGGYAAYVFPSRSRYPEATAGSARFRGDRGRYGDPRRLADGSIKGAPIAQQVCCATAQLFDVFTANPCHRGYACRE